MLVLPGMRGGGGVEAAGGLRRTAGEGGQIGKNCFD
jgi:hypothetical protein